MALNTRWRRRPLRLVYSEDTRNIDINVLNQSFTSMDEHAIRMRTLRSSPRRRSSLLSTSEISLLGSSGMSPDSSFDTTFDTSFGSDISASTPLQGPKIQTDRIRKRLVMLGHEEMETSITKSGTPAKRKKASLEPGPGWKRKLTALTQDQLVNLFEAMAKDRPDVQKEIERLVPEPDVSPMLNTLEHYRHDIYKSLPQSKWGSSRDAFCFRRVKTHLDNFKLSCITQGKQLLEAESWDACVEYTLKAADFIDRLPDWDEDAHNKTKQQCFKGVASQCRSAVKHSNLDKNRYSEIKAQVEEAMKLAKDFSTVLEVVEKKISKCK